MTVLIAETDSCPETPRSPRAADRDAMGSIPAAAPVPDEEVGKDPRPTPVASVVMPPAMLDDRPPPSSVPLCIRVERLQGELYEALRDKRRYQEIADVRCERANRLLDQARLGRRLVRKWMTMNGHDPEKACEPEWGDDLEALRAWAASVL